MVVCFIQALTFGLINKRVEDVLEKKGQRKKHSVVKQAKIKELWFMCCSSVCVMGEEEEEVKNFTDEGGCIVTEMSELL